MILYGLIKINAGLYHTQFELTLLRIKQMEIEFEWFKIYRKHN